MEFAVNTLRRKVPAVVTGKRKRPFHQAFDPDYADGWAGRPGESSGAGSGTLNIEMPHEGLIENLLHGQCFEPSEKVIHSLAFDHNHHSRYDLEAGLTGCRT